MSAVEAVAKEVAKEYERLGHTLGWRFLYSPARTLHWGDQLLVVGLNPGGGHYVAPQISVEEGNAYRLEQWGNSGGRNALQVQFRRLFEYLAAASDCASPDELMDSTATANFCPFRSQNWTSLPMRRASVDFSDRLWSRLIHESVPAVCVCIGHQTAHFFRRVYRNAGWRAKVRVPCGIGWGAARVLVDTFEGGGKECVLVALPHLSRFQFIGRPESQGAVDAVTGIVAERVFGIAPNNGLQGTPSRGIVAAPGAGACSALLNLGRWAGPNLRGRHV